MGIGDSVTREALNLIFLLDTSGSMYGTRIAQLNHAMPDALQEMAKVAIQEEADVFVRIINFNTTAKWIMGSAEKGVSIDEAAANWVDLTPTGSTDTAGAITLCLDALHTEFLGTRNYKPVVVQITDGASDSFAETKEAIQLLKKALSGNTGKEKVQRIAIGVEDYKEEELVAFASKGTIDEEQSVPLVFKVDDVDKLSSVLKCVAVSSLYSTVEGGGEDDELVIETGDGGEFDGWQQIP